jgi:hypothetical protein
MSSNKKKKIWIGFWVEGKHFVEDDDYEPCFFPVVLGLYFPINQRAKSKTQALQDFLSVLKSNGKKYNTVGEVFEEIQNGFFEGVKLEKYKDFYFHNDTFNTNYYLSLPILGIVD